MLDKAAIKELQQCPTTIEANKILAGHNLQIPTVALPSDYTVHDLEQNLPAPVRKRGHMKTSCIDSFTKYIKSEEINGAACFLNPEHMSATTILNHGSLKTPAHGDFRVTVGLDKLPDYSDLIHINGARVSQRSMAEWLEDHRSNITFIDHEEVSISTIKAINAIRSMTIESVRKAESVVGNFKDSNTLFESSGVSTEGLPSFIEYKCVPYRLLKERRFLLRVSISGDKDPYVTLRIIGFDQNVIEIANEFAEIVEGSLDGEVPVYIGHYS